MIHVLWSVFESSHIFLLVILLHVASTAKYFLPLYKMFWGVCLRWLHYWVLLIASVVVLGLPKERLARGLEGSLLKAFDTEQSP